MKNILALTVGLLLMSATLYAGNGDLIVNGNIGLGTTSPVEKIDVSDGSILATSLGNGGGKFGNIEVGYKGYYNAIRNTSGLYLNYNTNANVILVGGTSTGNVGIGTSSWPAQYKLYVAGPAFSTGWLLPSDVKFKKDIKQIDSALDKVNNLTGVSYLYKTDEYKDKGFPEGTQLGVIAQELEKVIPEAVMTDEEGTKAVNYSMIIPVLIEAIKAQQAEIEELKSKVK